MKKLFWYAFAMSLMISPLGARDLSMKVPSGPESEIQDNGPLKGQQHSLIDWETLDPEKWLSVEHWLIESESKSKNPDWRLRLRHGLQLEHVGKIMSCRGTCPVYRGTMPVSGQYHTRLVEGDEIRTEKETVAWIFLVDGTLLRLGPESSLSLQEINLGKNEIFIQARLNKGHVFWHARPKVEFIAEHGPETDSLTLPLKIIEANQQWFERKIFKSQKDSAQLTQLIDFEEDAVKSQVQRINELRSLHDQKMSVPTRVMLVAPNITLISTGASLDLVYVPGGKSYFKKRSAEGTLSVQLRGYTQTNVIGVEEEAWQEVAASGRSFLKLEEVSPILQLMELLTKRIKTLELAREIWVSQFTLPLLAKLDKPQALAREDGYSLWGDEIQRRFEFLTEYTRRIETTNIKSIDNLLIKIGQSGVPVQRELDADLYQHALNHYLKGLKQRYNLKEMQVREMSDLQYYVWVLKNGKI